MIKYFKILAMVLVSLQAVNTNEDDLDNGTSLSRKIAYTNIQGTITKKYSELQSYLDSIGTDYLASWFGMASKLTATVGAGAVSIWGRKVGASFLLASGACIILHSTYHKSKHHSQESWQDKLLSVIGINKKD